MYTCQNVLYEAEEPNAVRLSWPKQTMFFWGLLSIGFGIYLSWLKPRKAAYSLLRKKFAPRDQMAAEKHTVLQGFNERIMS